MRKDRIRHLADRLDCPRTEDIGFNMSTFYKDSDCGPACSNMVASDARADDAYHCGTLGCIAGWAVHIYEGFDEIYDIKEKSKGNYDIDLIDDHIYTSATNILELDRDTAQLLFNGLGHWCLPAITGPQAAKVLRHLADTGKVDWNMVNK